MEKNNFDQSGEIWLTETDSTMDAARIASAGLDFCLVTSEIQRSGRGTRGREWKSERGNIFMTSAIHRKFLKPGRMELLPLEIGLLILKEVSGRIMEPHRKALSLKWPNDLLLYGQKVAGILIEVHKDHVFIGIGINSSHAPDIDDCGGEASCLATFGLSSEDRELIIRSLHSAIMEALKQERDLEEEGLLRKWESHVDWSKQLRLRNRTGKPHVMPVRINNQGHLLVRHEQGYTEWLISDYVQ